jgi:hypothetical protein
MARVKELDLGRVHQVSAYRFARRELSNRGGGIILADGVGLGKTYEALATVATLLSTRQHGKEKKKQQAFRVLTIVPPRLITKWADELFLPDHFPKYMVDWISPATRAVASTFRDVVVLRRPRDLDNMAGNRRYGTNVLPPGFYLINVNLLHGTGQKVTQLHNTPWDAIIVDEAHLIARGLLHQRGQHSVGSPRTAVILLTATPFQLSPKELRHLLAETGGGNGSNTYDEIYDDPGFVDYRHAVNRFFRAGHAEDAKVAASLRDPVSQLLRSRVVRNTRRDGRVYHFVEADGTPRTVGVDLFRMDDNVLASSMKSDGLIEMPPADAEFYLKARNAVGDLYARGDRTFLAGALRQLLSTYQQFGNSAAGKKLDLVPPPGSQHPKLRAATELVIRLVRDELSAAESQGWVGKILIFTTYVGAEHGEHLPSSDDAHGTSAALKRSIEKALRSMSVLRKPSKKDRLGIFKHLAGAIARHGSHMNEVERQRLIRRLRVFAGTRLAGLLLTSPKTLQTEVRQFGALLEALAPAEVGERGLIGKEEEVERRLSERRERIYQSVIDRYATRDLVARYDGAVSSEQRDSHLRGFNSPFQPLVLIASSVGQEGIDLQKYCRHVVHYDLEWNPAKVEQREGRVDREGRLAKGPINVYFLLCRGTYDERVLHVMANRFRWHRVLLGNRGAMDDAPSSANEPELPPAMLKKMTLDLRPRRSNIR